MTADDQAIPADLPAVPRISIVGLVDIALPNAAESGRNCSPNAGGSEIPLVRSARHLPRARALFEAAGLTVRTAPATMKDAADSTGWIGRRPRGAGREHASYEGVDWNDCPKITARFMLP